MFILELCRDWTESSDKTRLDSQEASVDLHFHLFVLGPTTLLSDASGFTIYVLYYICQDFFFKFSIVESPRKTLE